MRHGDGAPSGSGSRTYYTALLLHLKTHHKHKHGLVKYLCLRRQYVVKKFCGKSGHDTPVLLVIVAITAAPPLWLRLPATLFLFCGVPFRQLHRLASLPAVAV